MPETSIAPAPLPASDNPLLQPWLTPLETPPFDQIAPEHFLPAFEQAFADHAAEIAAIVNDPSAPDFANTITALERAGRLLNRVAAVFYDLVSAHSNPALLAIDTDVSLRMARHWNPIMMNAVLFGRVALLYGIRATLGPDAGAAAAAGAHLCRASTAPAPASTTRPRRGWPRSTSGWRSSAPSFSHHLLGDEQDWSMELAPEDCEGLPDSFVAAAKAAAEERGLTGKAVLTLSRSSVEPFLKSSPRRDLREKLFKAFTARGDNGNANDNNAAITEILQLREETAKLLGYPTFAAYRLEDSMAKTPEAVRGLLERVWKPARARAMADRDDLQALIAEEGGNFALAPWDWRYYAEKLRQRRADFDDSAIKPYLALDNMIAAAFDTAHRLFGLQLHRAQRHPGLAPRRPGLGGDGRRPAAHKALFYGDYYARPSKRSGAWMTSLRDQQKLDGAVAPLIINVCNFAKGTDGAPALLSPDDARTLFHEFGHGLHGMLSDVTYPSLSGTSVFTDFVELPSQLYEHWQEQPQVLRQFARHYQSGEPLPDDLLKRFIAARKFNQGFATVEFVSSALLDLEFHTQPAAAIGEIAAFERRELDKIGMPEEIALRHRPTQFGHIFSGDHYASGYYSYMWSEVMDADAFGAFEEAGDIFDSQVAKRLHDDIYASGGSRDPAQAYVAFRGREPAPDALLRRRGLLDTPEAA